MFSRASERAIIGTMLCLTGKYNIPGETVTLRGYDMHGEPVEETVPHVDWKRIERDTDEILAGRLNDPVGLVTASFDKPKDSA
jgi:hypothetical protein